MLKLSGCQDSQPQPMLVDGAQNLFIFIYVLRMLVVSLPIRAEVRVSVLKIKQDGVDGICH